jgi:hypothetical protein
MPRSCRAKEMEMNTDNLQITPTKVKGPFTCRSVAIEAAKADPDCLKLGAFTLIKSHGYYDYVHGRKNVLMSDDVPMADYWLNMRNEWRHRTRGTR